MTKLTPRQLQVLILLKDGVDTQDIKTQLHISISTVRSHMKAIYTRLGIDPYKKTNKKILAVITAIKEGIITL